MKLAVFSHKLCQRAESSPTGYVTDGGFPLQMQAISKLFSRTSIVVPCRSVGDPTGQSPLVGNNLNVVPLTVPMGEGIGRKFSLVLWVIRNGSTIFREVRRADAVHTPIPGDIGTIGMILAMLFKKPLFVRHCGNWMVQRTAAEQFWKWSMERFAGGRNVMLATGGGIESPSEKNPNIKWIFSTSLTADQIAKSCARILPTDGGLRLITVCRQEKGKGTNILIDALSYLQVDFPGVSLDVVGGGNELAKLEEQARGLGSDSRITFHGKVEQAKVFSILKKADLFCYPTESEGFPKSVIEALASGMPVITTKVSVLPHLIGSGCGVILDRASSKDLVEAVIAIASDRELYQRMSSKAIETAAGYTLENWSEFIGEELCRSWGVQTLNGRGT